MSQELKSSPPLPPSLPPPPPPPPPPRLLPAPAVKLSPKALSGDDFYHVNESEIEFSLNRLISSQESHTEVFYMCHTEVKPQLQDGPKCGLVALSIATSTTVNPVSVDDIFQAALCLGFTKQGEMFSADSLAILAEKSCGFKATVLKGGLKSHLCCIINSLQRKGLVLVPYDADFNHSPCSRKGLRAHWALITGFIILSDTKHTHSLHIQCTPSCNCTNSTTDRSLPLAVSVHRGKVVVERRDGMEGRKNEGTEKDCGSVGKVYLIGRQGKSRHLGLWSVDAMGESNENLVSVCREISEGDYLMPEGGIVGGLKGKVIILENPGMS